MNIMKTILCSGCGKRVTNSTDHRPHVLLTSIVEVAPGTWRLSSEHTCDARELARKAV